MYSNDLIVSMASFSSSSSSSSSSLGGLSFNYFGLKETERKETPGIIINLSSASIIGIVCARLHSAIQLGSSERFFISISPRHPPLPPLPPSLPSPPPIAYLRHETSFPSQRHGRNCLKNVPIDPTCHSIIVKIYDSLLISLTFSAE